MSKKKGLSLEDKRKVVLNVYHSRKEAFNLKEIESIASKLGVVQQTIKDVNQSLVDDSLVQMDKIGSANFFWSFPSKRLQDLTVQRNNIQARIHNTSTHIIELKSLLEESRRSRSSPTRIEDLQELARLSQEEAEADARLKFLAANDPEEIRAMAKRAAMNKENCDRWTDNLWAVKSYLTKKRGMSPKEVDQMLGMDSSFDYLEYVPSATAASGPDKKKAKK